MTDTPALIDGAFEDRADLRDGLRTALKQTPQHATLFADVSHYVLNLKRPATVSLNGTSDGPTAKKRKIESKTTDGAGENGGASVAGGWLDGTAKASFAAPSISFSVPQRKKLDFELVSGKSGSADGVRGVNPASRTVEFGVALKDIEHVFCLPVPEKAKRQDNFVVLPRYGEGIGPIPDGVAVPEPMVWTVAEAPKSDLAQQEQEVGNTATALNQALRPHGKKVVFPTNAEFASNMVQNHRKGEQAYHVKAFKGSKEGYLFFLESGILFAFKKPLLFFPFAAIASISYTSVLQRTFNLLIGTQPLVPTTSSGADDDSREGQDIEFAMLDQADYAPIDAYVKRHGLNDASMAEARRAKRLNINPPSATAENGAAQGNGDAAGGEEEESELQKAERMLQDEEDEEEEDYDPGSEGESDGSGTSDEGEGDEGGDVGEEEEEEEDEGEDEGEDEA